MSVSHEITRHLLLYAATVAAPMGILALPVPLIVFCLRRRYPTAAAVRARLTHQPVVRCSPDLDDAARLRRTAQLGGGMFLSFGFGLGSLVSSQAEGVLGWHTPAFPPGFFAWFGTLLLLLNWSFLPHRLAWAWLARDTLRRGLLPSNAACTHGQPTKPVRFWPER